MLGDGTGKRLPVSRQTGKAPPSTHLSDFRVNRDLRITSGLAVNLAGIAAQAVENIY